MGEESGLRQAHLTPVECYGECVGPGDRIGTFEFGAGKDVVERGLNGGCTGVGNVDRNLTFPRNVGVGRRSREGDRTEDR